MLRFACRVRAATSLLIRSVSHVARRLKEAERLGFKRALVPETCAEAEREAGIELLRAPTLRAAIKMALT